MDGWVWSSQHLPPGAFASGVYMLGQHGAASLAMAIERVLPVLLSKSDRTLVRRLLRLVLLEGANVRQKGHCINFLVAGSPSW